MNDRCARACVRLPVLAAAQWEMGTVDPETLQRTAILKAPAELPWEVSPLPAFSRDLARIALPAEERESRGESAILVFRDGKLEAVLPLRRDVECGSVEWLPDDLAHKERQVTKVPFPVR